MMKKCDGAIQHGTSMQVVATDDGTIQQFLIHNNKSYCKLLIRMSWQ